jgi:hypothetical protein
VFFQPPRVGWDDWVHAWENDSAGAGHQPIAPAVLFLEAGVVTEPSRDR